MCWQEGGQEELVVGGQPAFEGVSAMVSFLCVLLLSSQELRAFLHHTLPPTRVLPIEASRPWTEP